MWTLLLSCILLHTASEHDTAACAGRLCVWRATWHMPLLIDAHYRRRVTSHWKHTQLSPPRNVTVADHPIHNTCNQPLAAVAATGSEQVDTHAPRQVQTRRDHAPSSCRHAPANSTVHARRLHGTAPPAAALPHSSLPAASAAAGCVWPPGWWLAGVLRRNTAASVTAAPQSCSGLSVSPSTR